MRIRLALHGREHRTDEGRCLHGDREFERAELATLPSQRRRMEWGVTASETILPWRRNTVLRLFCLMAVCSGSVVGIAGNGRQVQLMTAIHPQATRVFSHTLPPMNRAQPSASLASALSAVFRHDMLASNVVAVTQRAATLSLQERIEFLSQHVLPSEAESRLRMRGQFAQSSPPPGADVATVENSICGIVSPVFLLLSSVEQSEALPQLRELLSTLHQPDEPHRRRALTALRFMADVADNDVRSANDRLAELVEQVRRRQMNVHGEWWPETLALAYAVDADNDAIEIGDLISMIYDMQIGQSVWSGNTACDHFVGACFAAANDADGHPSDVRMQRKEFEGWASASITSAETRGRGVPPASWDLRGAAPRKIAGHHDDYLFLPMPLLGDFEIQCDVTGFNYREAQLTYADKFVSHFYTLSEVEVGSVRGKANVTLERPMTYPEKWLSARIDVRDGIAQHFVNGRKLLSRHLPAQRSPWTAVRAYRLSHGSIRNVTIIGNPVVPQTVPMISSPDLDGWFSYYREAVASPENPEGWQCVQADGAGPTIVRESQPEFSRTQAEGLLMYARPMMENGTIEYKFFYSPGKTAVFPAIDRVAFVLSDQSVRLHHVTDAQFDPGFRRNGMDEPSELLSTSDNIPLVSGEWNQLTFSLTADTVEVRLNETCICRYTLKESNSRQFGLFHFVGETNVRVRDMKWTGTWPRSLDSPNFPNSVQAELAEIEQQTAALPKSVEFSLDGKRFPSAQFKTRGQFVQPGNAGLKMKSRSPGNWKQSEAYPSLQVGGDFDLRASFRDFQHADSGASGVKLKAHLQNTRQEILISRIRGSKTRQEVKIESIALNENGEKERVTDWVTNEVQSGTLRLVRLGETLFYLLAEDESTVFRQLGTTKIGRGELQIGEIGLVALADLNGEVEVDWTSISVRAERLSGGASVDLEAEVRAIKKQRDALPAVVDLDLVRDPSLLTKLSRWGPPVTKNRDEEGFKLQSVGAEQWATSGFALTSPIFGNFDVRVEFDKLDLAIPGDGQQTVFSLEVEPYTAISTQFICMLGVEPLGESLGRIEAEGYTRVGTADGKAEYHGTERTVVRSATALRIVRRGTRYIMLVRADGEKRDRIVSITENTATPIRRIKVQLHTGGAGRTSSVLIRKLSLRADRLALPTNRSEPGRRQ